MNLNTTKRERAGQTDNNKKSERAGQSVKARYKMQDEMRKDETGRERARQNRKKNETKRERTRQNKKDKDKMSNTYTKQKIMTHRQIVDASRTKGTEGERLRRSEEGRDEARTNEKERDKHINNKTNQERNRKDEHNPKRKNAAHPKLL